MKSNWGFMSGKTHNWQVARRQYQCHGHVVEHQDSRKRAHTCTLISLLSVLQILLTCFQCPECINTFTHNRLLIFCICVWSRPLRWRLWVFSPTRHRWTCTCWVKPNTSSATACPLFLPLWKESETSVDFPPPSLAWTTRGETSETMNCEHQSRVGQSLNIINTMTFLLFSLKMSFEGEKMFFVISFSCSAVIPAIQYSCSCFCIFSLHDTCQCFFSYSLTGLYSVNTKHLKLHGTNKVCTHFLDAAHIASGATLGLFVLCHFSSGSWPRWSVALSKLLEGREKWC